MRLISDIGRYRVPFEFEAKTAKLKVTRYTTFNDVVHMLTYKAGIPKTSATFYAVYECTWDLERKIGGAVRVLSIWRSWGCESSHFWFVVKRSDSNILLKHLDRSPTAKAEGEIDEMLSQSYKKASTQKLMEATRDSYVSTRSSLKGSEMEQLSRVTLMNHNCASLANIAFHLDKTVGEDTSSKTNSRTEQRNNESGGKKALLAKYLNDLKFFNKRKSKKAPGKLGERKQADGAEVPEVCLGRHVEGMEDCSAPLQSSPLNSTTVSMAKCRYHWERHCGSDTDSDISDNFIDIETESDEESDVSSTSSLARDIRALDTAFVKSSRCSESDEGIDVTSMTSSDLNTAFVVDFERKCSTADEYSALAYSVCDFEKNISISDYVRKVFGADDTQSVGSQDDEVDSFMRSRLDSF